MRDANQHTTSEKSLLMYSGCQSSTLYNYYMVSNFDCSCIPRLLFLSNVCRCLLVFSLHTSCQHYCSNLATMEDNQRKDDVRGEDNEPNNGANGDVSLVKEIYFLFYFSRPQIYCSLFCFCNLLNPVRRWLRRPPSSTDCWDSIQRPPGVASPPQTSNHRERTSASDASWRRIQASFSDGQRIPRSQPSGKHFFRTSTILCLPSNLST